MNELNNLFKNRLKTLDKESDEELKIRLFILKIIKELNEEIFGDVLLRDKWGITIDDSSILIKFKFGRIGIEELSNIRAKFKKHNFVLTMIFSKNETGDTGLFLEFRYEEK